ncbi:hypothetical protein BH09PLA1_BH09PLA1_34780 [soil metagenome]
MTSSPLAPAPSPAAPVGRVSLQFALLIFCLAIVAQWLVYSQSFAIKPASDDWPIINEIHRGNLQGVGVFFTDSVIQIGYRPLKSLTIWWFGNLDPNHRVEWVRVLHLLGGMLFAFAGMLWLRELPIGKVAFIAGMLLVTLHPVLPQCLGSIDGIDTAASSGFLWLGAWCLYRFRGRPIPALVTSLICFFIGVGFKENLFALAPLAMVIVVMFWPRDRIKRDAAIVALAYALAFLSMVLIRRIVIRGGLSSGYNMIRFDPITLAKNAATFATGLLFFGDSLWVYIHQSAAVLALVGASCLAAFGLIVAGLWLRVRDNSESAKRWIIFFLIGGCAASFPTILLFHVSEMYVPPMLVPFAMLCVLAIDGWLRFGSRPMKIIVAAVCALALVTSIATIRDKIAGLARVGERADVQFKAMLDHIPPGTKDKKILLLFYPSELGPRATYSVFMIADAILLGQPVTPEYYRPGDNLRVESITAPEPEQYDQAGWDYVLLWDARSATFRSLK